MPSILRDILRQHASSLAPEDLSILLTHVTKRTREYLLAHPEYILSNQTYHTLLSLIRRRQRHEPIAYLTGRKECFGFSFQVDYSTLIPRPETEILIELVQKKILKNYSNNERNISLVDVGTGSGCIILSLAKVLSHNHHPGSLTCFGLDISSNALKRARRNRKELQPMLPVRFLTSDLLTMLPQKTVLHTDHIIIVANLPYLSKTIYTNCPPDVKKYEPKTALMSDTHGLSHIFRLLRQVKDIHHTHPSISLDIWLEISPEQKKRLETFVKNIFETPTIHCHQDLAGKNRIIEICIVPSS